MAYWKRGHRKGWFPLLRRMAPDTGQGLAPCYLVPASFIAQHADWSCNSQLSWKQFRLELFQMDLQELGLEISAIQPLCKHNTYCNLMKIASCWLNFPTTTTHAPFNYRESYTDIGIETLSFWLNLNSLSSELPFTDIYLSPTLAFFLILQTPVKLLARGTWKVLK